MLSSVHWNERRPVMKFRNRTMKLAIPMGMLVAAIIIGVPGENPVAEVADGLALVRPAFAQASEASFLEVEAGIAAYVNVGQTIDPGRARSAFSTVERETESYIIGSVADVHVYAHQDGWVVAYYLRGVPTSGIFGEKYGTSAGDQNRLKDALGTVSSLMGVAPTAVNYYHFGYPGANKLMKIVGTEFRVKIPNEFIVFEASEVWWALYWSRAVYERYNLIDIPPNDTFIAFSYAAGAVVLVYRE